EFEIKKILSDDVSRGKVEFSLTIQDSEDSNEVSINKNLFKKYFQELNSLANELHIDKGDILQTILRIPNVISSDALVVDEKEWLIVQTAITEAIKAFNQYRIAEGAAMKTDLKERLNNILQLLAKIDPHEINRIHTLRLRLKQLLEDNQLTESVDNTRFEQEILYYLEKIDINEEKVRLTQHCNYFLEELDNSEIQKGRKLGFICQEIGREINTLGAKAYASEIQRNVVMMKDELEKIKEQIANIV
ncbi:MAG: DUF1732 domain-containing protein, partial [Saprospiraceae bacterium]|nr:DUF1732 domain-containing protein [Saprospiraceae bacterium]